MKIDHPRTGYVLTLIGFAITAAIYIAGERDRESDATKQDVRELRQYVLSHCRGLPSE